MDHRAEGTDTLLKSVKWGPVFGTVLLGSERRYCIFRSQLVRIFGPIAGEKSTAYCYQISYIVPGALISSLYRLPSPYPLQLYYRKHEFPGV